MNDSFQGWLATQENGQFAIARQTLQRDQLPAGDVLIRVRYSSLNYKDGLAVTGKPGVIRQWPMVPGIDLAGVVEEDTSGGFRAGDKVVVTGCGTSETIWGGYAEYARMKSEFCVALPDGLSLQQAMGIGTAGVTAMQCVMALEAHGLQPDKGEVVVTGAAGGVGSVAIAVLAKLGYRVVASSGRAEQAEYLKHLGASDVIDRSVLSTPSKRPLESERWAGAVDSVGGETLAGVLRTMRMKGSVAACGLAGGSALPMTVLPFILRGVSLLGIDSVRLTNVERRAIWQRLSTDLPLALLDEITTVESWDNVPELGAKILKGETRGRVVVQVAEKE